MNLEEMPDDLPGARDHGAKKNAKSFLVSWIGYKLNLDTADCGVPVSAIMTSASVHDSQVAIPLATMTAARVTNLYDLMDAAYDANEIHRMSERRGHVPLIDVNPRRDTALKQELKREARGTARVRSCHARECSLPASFRDREDQCLSQGRVRCPSCACPWACNSVLPPHVRSARADG